MLSGIVTLVGLATGCDRRNLTRTLTALGDRDTDCTHPDAGDDVCRRRRNHRFVVERRLERHSS